MVSSRWSPALVVVLVLAAPACKPRGQGTAGTEMTPPPTLAPSPAPTPPMTARDDVKVVVITPGPKPTADPDPVRVGADRQIVVWVLAGNGAITDLHFTQSPFPNGQQPTCRGRFCWVGEPPEKKYIGQTFKYEATTLVEGQTQKSDPNVEVIP
jgi:hypothetical protein